MNCQLMLMHQHPPPPPVAPTVITVESLTRLPVKELKEELKKRGRSTTGKKEELRARLKEAIELNVPIASGNEPPHHESMSGLDVTARWEMLTPNEFLVSEPENVDLSHRPPTERDATINRKYGFRETFIRVPFTGTTKKMAYVRPEFHPQEDCRLQLPSLEPQQRLQLRDE
jgi:hypothetical protein